MPYRNYRFIIWMIMAAVLFIGTRLTARESLVLTVVWVSQGDLWGWRQGDGNPILLGEGDVPGLSNQVRDAKPLAISPDGARVAFVRGNNLESLWVSDWQEAREVVSSAQLPVEEHGQSHIVDISWADANTLYLNTGASWIPRPGIVRRDDWWKVDIQTGVVKQILPPGEGGTFSFSPDGRYATLTTPGLYDREEGVVRLVDLATGESRIVFSYPAVSTGSNYFFYPELFWEADSSAFRFVIPNKDLVYHDSARDSVLWRVSVENSAEELGSVRASFYGLPQWSSDGQSMSYIRRPEGEGSNRLELMLAQGDGSEAVVYTSGEVGTLGASRWLSGSKQFVFEQGQPGMYWVGKPGEEANPLPDRIYLPLFLANGLYVCVTESFELRYAQVTQTDSNFIAAMDSSVPVFDAVLALNHPTT